MTGPAARDDGVSSVVAAALVVALFATAMSLWTVVTLPEWIADREQNHQDLVQDRFSFLQSGIEGLGAVAPGASISAVVPLGASPVPLVQLTPATGELSFESDVRLQVALTGAALHAQDGAAVGAPDAPATGTLPGVQDFTAFSLGLATSGVGVASGGTTADSAWVRAAATDGAATVTATLEHSDDVADCGGRGLHVQVVAPAGTADTVLLCGLGPDLGSAMAPYRFDLAGHAPFSAALRDLSPGFALTLSSGATAASATGTYSAVWRTTDGEERVAGSGQASSWSLDEPGDRLRFTPAYQSFVAQDVAYEAGAVVLEQASGAVVLSDPGFSLSVSGGVGHLEWTLVDVEGSGGLSGKGDARVGAVLTGASDLRFSATGATLTLQGDLAPAWRTFLEDRLLLADGPDGATVTGTGTTASLELSAAGAVTSWVLHLRVLSVQVAVS